MTNQPDGYPFAYLKEMAINVALDYFKHQGAQKRGSGQALENVDDVQPASSARSMGGEADMDWQILKGQIEDAAKNLGYSHKELAIFHLYYYQGWTADQISKLPGESGAAGPLDSTPILPRPPGGLSVKGVESLIHRMTKDLRNFFGDDEGP